MNGLGRNVIVTDSFYALDTHVQQSGSHMNAPVGHRSDYIDSAVFFEHQIDDILERFDRALVVISLVETVHQVLQEG